MFRPSDKALQAYDLRNGGHTLEQVGEALGVSRAYAGMLVAQVERWQAARRALSADADDLWLLSEAGLLPRRVVGALRRELGIETVGELARLSERELGWVQSVGAKGIAAIKALLAARGLTLPGSAVNGRT
jgi:hypothetical protein